MKSIGLYAKFLLFILISYSIISFYTGFIFIYPNNIGTFIVENLLISITAIYFYLGITDKHQEFINSAMRILTVIVVLGFVSPFYPEETYDYSTIYIYSIPGVIIIFLIRKLKFCR